MAEQQARQWQWIVLAVRWFARTLAVLLGGLLIAFIIGEGPPPIGILLPWLAVLAAFALGWKYEGLAALILVGGFAYFNAIEYAYNHHLLRFGAFHLLLMPAAGFLFCWIADRRTRKRSS